MTRLTEVVWSEKDLYLPYIKKKCVWCGFPLTGKWEWYERYGNGCVACNGRAMDVVLKKITREESVRRLKRRIGLVREAKEIKKHNKQSFFKIFKVLDMSE